ncbi:MAG: HD domain-containing protein [Nitrosopumilus sp.]|nr:HD domain-containing protein [Nitrosopumilus sp.]MDH3515449.1 HD domain-containing protein [Nitrosopumilus sp.]MDH3564251.1 HD domain-containing protein [Nitrosopumilus sp.]MDH5416597.1 HD domain-containing protein [Nitrosopumilus sp.]MDH5555136.1 HD domain-containing protein [Nitrosopumilus sp.]
MQNFNNKHPLKNKIQELLNSSGTEKIECFHKMLNYTIQIFESQGIGRDYYGFHNIDHELEVTYITLLAALWEKKLQKLDQKDIEYLYTAALFHDFDPQKSVDRPHEESVIQFISMDIELKKLINEAELDIEIIKALILRTSYPWAGEFKEKPEMLMKECFQRSKITKDDPEKQSHYEELGWFLSVADRIGGYAMGDFSNAMEKAKKNAHAFAWHQSTIARMSVNFFETLLNNESKMCRRVLHALPEKTRKNFMDTVLSFMKLRQDEIRIESKFEYENQKFQTRAESLEERNSDEFITSLTEIYNELPQPLQLQKSSFAKSILNPNTILTTLRLNDDSNTIIGYAKGGPLEDYQLYAGIKDENYGKKNTIFLEPIAMRVGYWGLGGGTRLRKVFSLLANSKRYRYLTSFALRDLIQKRMGSENVEFVAMLDPEHWDYYRVDLLGGIV